MDPLRAGQELRSCQRVGLMTVKPAINDYIVMRLSASRSYGLELLEA